MPKQELFEDNRKVIWKKIKEFQEQHPDITINLYYKENVQSSLPLFVENNLTPKLRVKDELWTFNKAVTDHFGYDSKINANAALYFRSSELLKIEYFKSMKLGMFVSVHDFTSIFSTSSLSFFTQQRKGEYQKLLSIPTSSIIRALNTFNSDNVKPQEESKKFFIQYKNANYPAKYILKQAFLEVNKRELDYRSNEESTIQFLIDRGLKFININDEMQDDLFELNSKSFAPINAQGHSTNIDYIAKAMRDKEVGDAGEKFVIKTEQKYLIENGKEDLAALVIKKVDGEGYDILSYDLNGGKKFIEVKTTTGDFYTDFFITSNELDFQKNNSDKYFLYRVYQFNMEKNEGLVKQFNSSIFDQLEIIPKIYICCFHDYLL